MTYPPGTLQFNNPYKPKYDPWEVFKPTKTFIREVIKQLREQCYAIQAQIQKAKNHDDALRQTFVEQYQNRAFDVYRKEYDDFLFTAWGDYYQQKLDAVNRRIRQYTFRLRGIPKGTGFQINPDILQRAKESPIQDYLTCRNWRQVAGRLVTSCPFHKDDTPSFAIYTKDNTWHCFSCGAGRDVIDFIMRQQNLKFIEAVRYILHL